eukprot:6172291-Pleurochrysis_carterae.AAC.2
MESLDSRVDASLFEARRQFRFWRSDSSSAQRCHTLETCVSCSVIIVSTALASGCCESGCICIHMQRVG